MSLLDTGTPQALRRNIQTEIEARTKGKTGTAKKKAIKQAEAIGYAVQRRAQAQGR